MKNNLRKIFINRKDWIWVLFFLLGGISITMTLIVDYGIIRPESYIDMTSWVGVKCVLWEAAEFMCNVIVTYGTMLVASVIFFYSMIDNKRLGIPYRWPIKYTIGSHTIPILFMMTLLLTVFMVMARSASWKYTTYACMGYILLVQIFVIFNILLSTSYKHCKQIICRDERKRYIKGEDLYDIREFAGHLERAVHSDEFIQDKAELLADFLQIPFGKHIRKIYEKEMQKEIFDEKNEWKRIYRFYFVNTLSAFQDFDSDIKYLELNCLYMCIRDFLKEYIGQNGSGMKDMKRLFVRKYGEEEGIRKIRYIYYIVLSGITNGLLSGNARNCVELCRNILLKCELENEVKSNQMHLWVLFREALDLLDVETEPRNLEMEELGKWELLEEEKVAFCADMWEVWMEMYDVSFYSKVRHFNAAIQTMTGHHNASDKILRMRLMMRKQDEEKDSGEKYINQDTFAEE
ncbi:MAG: hypothetical protein K2N00_06515 [Lachnospiraceae bacterium]|nr:hypothetical protein [Lachnospiraceae bacterium]